MNNVRVIFDNGGGITLQLGGWSCWYNEPKNAARDYYQYLQDRNTDGWEGHDEDSAALDPAIDEINNGGYRIYNSEEISDEVKNDESTGWDNIDEFYLAIVGLNA